MVLGLSKRIPARPTAAHAMATTPTTPTSTRLTRWRWVNFMPSPPPARGRHHERREAVVVRVGRAVARVAVGRTGAQIDVAGARRVVNAGHRRCSGHLHLALLLPAARPLVGVA